MSLKVTLLDAILNIPFLCSLLCIYIYVVTQIYTQHNTDGFISHILQFIDSVCPVNVLYI